VTERFVPLCPASTLRVGEMRKFTLPNGDAVALYNISGAYYATADMCTHANSSLSDEGTLEGPIIECGWHRGRFDVRTGEAVAAPCQVPLRCYKVADKDGAIGVMLQEP
jgi:p-cumate 2,3-dioxygenase ferredoxin subunit